MKKKKVRVIKKVKYTKADGTQSEREESEWEDYEANHNVLADIYKKLYNETSKDLD